MPYEDYRLNAQVRALFVRRWIDLSKLQFGVTNGVVYIQGSLRPHVRESLSDGQQDRVQDAVNAGRLERALRQIPGVRDVIFQLDNVVKVGWRWRPR